LSILFASIFVYCTFLEKRTDCSAASGDIAIRIMSPAPGAVLVDWKALVKGELSVPVGTEVGVTINGFVALVSREKFATMLPLNFPTPTTEVSVTVTNSLGTVLATHFIPITAKNPDTESILTLRAYPVLGMAPQSVRFTMTSLKQIAPVEMDWDGDGTIDWQGATLEGKEFPLREAGLYFPTVRVTDVEGKIYSENTLVQVFDPKELDALLQAKWTAMKVALRQGDIGRAVSYINTKKRDGYRKVFETLTIPLANIDQVLTNVKFVKLAGIRAEYEMLYMEGGAVFSGIVNFSLDMDGIWRIDFF